MCLICLLHSSYQGSSQGSHRLELPCCGEGGPFDLRKQSTQSKMSVLIFR